MKNKRKNKKLHSWPRNIFTWWSSHPAERSLTKCFRQETPPPAQPSPAMCEQVAQAWHSSLSVCARAPGCQYQVIKWTRLKYFCHNYGDTVVHSERMPWGPLTDGQGALQMTRQNKKVYGLLSNGISGSEILVSLKTVWFPVTLHKIPYFR